MPGDHEGGPDRAADLVAHLADERVDPAAEDVPDDEEQQHVRVMAGLSAVSAMGGPYPRAAAGTLAR